MSAAAPARRLLLLAFALAGPPRAAAAQAATPAATATAAPAGRIYVGTYTKRILVLDEATLAVTDTIPVSVGIPLRVAPSDDWRRLYVVDAAQERVEILDLATRRAVDRFTLSGGGRTVRIWGFNVDPRDRFAVLLVKTYAKQADRWEVGKPTLVKYDLARRAVTDTIPWPKGEERDFAQILFSPDGELLYFFTTDDVLIYSTRTLKQVDRWDLSRTLFEEGVGRLDFFFPYDVYEDPGFFTGLFRTTDPVNRRQLMGIARVDLARRAVDFHTLGPGTGVSFRLAPGRRRAYGLRRDPAFGTYQFWTFDLEQWRVAARTDFPGRPRMGLTVSSDGRSLYVHTAGPTIDVYDAATLQRARTVDLGADMTALVLVPPRPAGARPGAP